LLLGCDGLDGDRHYLLTLGQTIGSASQSSRYIYLLPPGKVKPWDAFFYIVAQFLGGLIGLLLVAKVLREAIADLLLIMLSLAQVELELRF